MTVHHARVIALVVLVGITALSLGLHLDAQQPVADLPLDDLRVLAEQGDAEAQFNLGTRYASGRGVPEDETEAVRWFRLAADQGHITAQLNLGARYAIGQGVPEDDAESVRWLRLAADQGAADAQHSLGTRYERGLGVPQNIVASHMWFTLAAARSSDENSDAYAKARDAVAARMTADQIAEAQRRAREWTPTPEP